MAALIVACGDTEEEQISEFAPRNLTVLVGGARGTSSLNEFFPRSVEIRAGDTVTWRMNGNADDPHTVTFAPDLDEVVDIVPRPNGGRGEFIFATTLVVPSRRSDAPVEEYKRGGYFNSGIMFGYQIGEKVPMIDTFSMKFPEPGTYRYICGIHEFHRGTVVVKEATLPDLPNQEDIDRAARLQMEFGMGIVNSLQSLVAQESTVLDVEPGLDGTTRYMVAAGMGTPEAEVLEFFPRNLNVKKGDTVTWVSTRFHAVVFGDDDGVPVFYQTEPRIRSTPYIVANPCVLFPSDQTPGDSFPDNPCVPPPEGPPSPEYDGTGFRSSGLIGYGQRPGGLGYTLTFTEAGTFTYSCPVHRGMVGRVTVSDG
jgi:plastocyanin